MDRRNDGFLNDINNESGLNEKVTHIGTTLIIVRELSSESKLGFLEIRQE